MNMSIVILRNFLQRFIINVIGGIAFLFNSILFRSSLWIPLALLSLGLYARWRYLTAIQSVSLDFLRRDSHFLELSWFWNLILILFILLNVVYSTLTSWKILIYTDILNRITFLILCWKSNIWNSIFCDCIRNIVRLKSILIFSLLCV